jgi:hypothetical protein
MLNDVSSLHPQEHVPRRHQVVRQTCYSYGSARWPDVRPAHLQFISYGSFKLCSVAIMHSVSVACDYSSMHVDTEKNVRGTLSRTEAKLCAGSLLICLRSSSLGRNID